MYIIYDNMGNIVKQYMGDSVESESNGYSWIHISGDDFIQDSLFYVNIQEKEIIARQDYTLENLPLPCTITIEGISYEVTEQPTFEFDVVGEYIIEVDAGVEYLKKEFKYVVEA